MRAKTRTITMSSKKADALKAEVERRMKTGETFSISEIRMIMKSTGLSYAQVISQTKSLKNLFPRQWTMRVSRFLLLGMIFVCSFSACGKIRNQKLRLHHL